MYDWDKLCRAGKLKKKAGKLSRAEDGRAEAVLDWAGLGWAIVHSGRIS